MVEHSSLEEPTRRGTREVLRELLGYDLTEKISTLGPKQGGDGKRTWQPRTGQPKDLNSGREYEARLLEMLQFRNIYSYIVVGAGLVYLIVGWVAIVKITNAVESHLASAAVLDDGKQSKRRSPEVEDTMHVRSNGSTVKQQESEHQEKFLVKNGHESQSPTLDQLSYRKMIETRWAVLAAMFVFFMPAGFAMIAGGLSRAKNVTHTMAMNFMICPLGALGFWAYGFAIGWGNFSNGAFPVGWTTFLGSGLSVLDEGLGIGAAESNSINLFKYGLMGAKGFFLSGAEDVSILAFWFFMVVLLNTTANIPIGTMAERWSWRNFCLYGLWVTFPYCLYANWVWGGGWLAQSGINWGFGHGGVDFAGSGVVHAMGGIISLVGGIIVGPRIGKYVNGKPQAIPGHSIQMVCVGTFVLAFGWFGFNAGPILADTDLRISLVVVNTLLAATTAALACMCWLMFKGKKPDLPMMCNGMLAGLVAITAPCAFINTTGAAIVGAVAGVLVVESVFFWDRLGVDDVVGAISVHGVNGLWGMISVGLFATGEYGAGWNGVNRPEWTYDGATDGVRGLFYGDSSQLIAQLLNCAAVIGVGVVCSFAFFNLSASITPIRVSRQTELEGPDGPEMGAFVDFNLALKGTHLDA